MGSRLSVTIVSHESQDQLRSCLGSLQRHPYTLGEMEVVVVDNASEDGSVAMVRQEFPETIVVAKRRRAGFGENQNEAVSVTTGDVLFLLNPDAAVQEHTIDRLSEALDRRPGVVAAGGPAKNEDGSIRQDRPWPFPSVGGRYAKAFGLSKVRSRSTVDDHVFSSAWPSGAAFVITRQAFEAAGGFDESFFMYAEDTDLFARLAADGHSFAWVSQAWVVHPQSSEDPSAARRRATQSVRGEMRYAAKHFGRLGTLAYRVAIITDSALRLLALSMPGLNKSVRLHGTTPAYQRSIHRYRIAAAVGRGSHHGLSELAAEWNLHNAADAH